MNSRVNIKIKENFRAQNLSSAAMVFIYKHLGRPRAEFLKECVKSLCPTAWAVPHCWSMCVPHPYILDILCLQERPSVILSSPCRPWSTTNMFLFCLFTECFFFYCITQISFCLSVKYVRFCYSCPNRPCPVTASFFLGGRSLNIENSSFSAWRLL